MPDTAPSTVRALPDLPATSVYALPAEEVAEIIRMPAVARVPQAPKGLLGLANLRGAVLPVASLQRPARRRPRRPTRRRARSS